MVGDVRLDPERHEVSVRGQMVNLPLKEFELLELLLMNAGRVLTRDTGGTGLGLSIVRHVAFNHGGEVSVTSQEGRGSTFTLTLPSGPPTKAPAPLSLHPAADRSDCAGSVPLG